MRIDLSDDELAVLRWEYEETPLTVAEIGLRHGLSGQTVSKIARFKGWKLRRQSKAAATAGPATVRVRPIEAPGIAERICKVIILKLDQMEKDMNSGELSSADLERDSKTIGSMIGGMQKVTPIASEDKVSKLEVNRPAVVENASEVERLQREIIERFERIQSRREADSGSQ